MYGPLTAAEALIEHHLEDILCNNSQAVTAALQAELENALKPQNQRKRASLGYTHKHTTTIIYV